MRQDRLESAALCLGAAVLALCLFLVSRPAAPVTPVEESPSYWHYLDSVSPREDTAHYETRGMSP